MAIVVYRCDTCKREVELIRNIRGLETPNRCVITHGCRGKLIQKDLLEDFSRASLPEEVEGLDDWIPRRVLYNHEQTIENSVWIVTHNLGTFPSISVFADRPTLDDPNNREEVTPGDIQILDKNNLLLRFDRPYSGIAQLVARSSDPQLFEPIDQARTTESFQQISNSGLVVLATRAKPEWNNTTHGVELEFISSTGSTTAIGYTSSQTLLAGTAWKSSNRVVIGGKVYELRAFNAKAAEMTAGSIVNGTVFRVKAFDFDVNLEYEKVVDSTDILPGSPAPTTLAPGEVYVLLSSSPYDSVDKILDHVIDITAVTKTQNSRAMYYDSGELFASESIMRTAFPLLRPLSVAAGSAASTPTVEYVTTPFTIDNAMWSWWTKPVVMRDYGATKDKTYIVFTESDGSVGLAVVDHKQQTTNRYVLPFTFDPDDHNAGCVVTGNGKVAVFMQGRNIVGQPGEDMFYIEFNEDEDPSTKPLQSCDFAIAPQRSNYPNAFNSNGQLFVLSRNQQALGGPQWRCVLGTWPLTTFSAPKDFFQSLTYTWPYFAIRRSTANKSVFKFALGWHPFDSTHHDIYYGEIRRNGATNPWDVVSGGVTIGNLTTAAGLPFAENDFEKVFTCPGGYSTRLFDIGEDCVVFAVFDPAIGVADYRYATKENGVWANYSICSGGMPFHGLGIRNYYGGMSVSERNKYVVTLARESGGVWFAEEYQSADRGVTWTLIKSIQAAPGQIFGRPMEEVLSEESLTTDTISTLWTGTYSPSDYTVFDTDVVSFRHPVYPRT